MVQITFFYRSIKQIKAEFFNSWHNNSSNIDNIIKRK